MVPAVDGTINALKAAYKHGVKRVVVTSSCAAIMSPSDLITPRPDKWTEEHWTQPDNIPNLGDSYTASKALAEKAAWDYQKTLPAGQRFDLVTICPGLVLGPAFCGKGFASGEIMELFMMGKMPSQPRVQMNCVDVREVA